MTTDTISTAAAAGELIKLAGQRAYECGVAYYQGGRVSRLAPADLLANEARAAGDGEALIELAMRVLAGSSGNYGPGTRRSGTCRCC